MLMMQPLPHAFSGLNAALHMVKVPSVSMSNTATTNKLQYTLLRHKHGTNWRHNEGPCFDVSHVLRVECCITHGESTQSINVKDCKHKQALVHAFSGLGAALHMVKVPRISMSKTNHMQPHAGFSTHY